MVSGSAPANASPPASWSPRSTRSWTNALTSVSQCDGRLGALICCFRPEHVSSTATSINSSVAATQRSGNRQATNLPPVCDGLLSRGTCRWPSWVYACVSGTNLSGVLEAQLNPLLRGWIAYYGRFSPSELHPLLCYVNQTLLAWAKRKF